MKFIAGTRLPLSEDSFIDAEAARFYDEHARRFMGSVYRRLAVKAAGISLPGKRVLDVGTGSGLLAIELAKTRSDLFIKGIDISEEMLKLARQNAARSGFNDNIEFRQAPAEALPFPDGSFDLVASNTSLHLWTDPRKVFQEISRVTSPGGYCLVWDNLRLAVLSPFLGLIGMAMGMNAAQCLLWMRAIRSSYTISEARAIIKESALQGARVCIIPDFFMLGIAWRKQPSQLDMTTGVV